jgi:glutamate racemase
MPGADYFVRQKVGEMFALDPCTDCRILGCTHYPLLLDKIEKFVPANVKVISQGDYVAQSLQDYLFRHPDMQERITQGGTLRLLTTEHPRQFNENASIFLHHAVEAERIVL